VLSNYSFQAKFESKILSYIKALGFYLSKRSPPSFSNAFPCPYGCKCIQRF